MRCRLFRGLLRLATLLLMGATAARAGTRVSASADAGFGMLGLPQFPALFGPVGSRIALHHQFVPVSDAHSRAQSAMALTLGLVY